jgi:hypothetical protein
VDRNHCAEGNQAYNEVAELFEFLIGWNLMRRPVGINGQLEPEDSVFQAPHFNSGYAPTRADGSDNVSL